MTIGAAIKGMAAGVAGVAAMTLAEELGQLVTGRPNSYVPSCTLRRLTGRTPEDDPASNWAMHWGQGFLHGAARGLMAEHGVCGPFGSFLHMNLRLLNDRAFENATGAGAPPRTWPVDEQVIDLVHKGIYASVAGAVSDRLNPGPPSAVLPRGG